ncbi:YidH family protein [Rhodococcus wratislaviensis]|uniref:YidH family protein n=1 Tax=Rhodococcus wratislaviensis TaxID=44752 RepID=UPI00365E9E6B
MTVRSRTIAWAGLRQGNDPDPRFTMANERTYLAWIRTALALIAAALALEAFGGTVVPTTIRLPAAITLLAGAVLVAALALIRWLRVEIALRHGRSLPLPGSAVLVALLVAGAGLAAVVVLVW